MRDDQELMTKFVKIVERHPEIYDHGLDSYRTRYADIAWDKVAASVKSELNENCTVEELKIKWKGVRSSFNRYKNKLYQSQDANPCKKYYLYDVLRFLDPFAKPKGCQGQEKGSEGFFDECVSYIDTDENDQSAEYNNIGEWEASDIKPDIAHSSKNTNSTAVELTRTSRDSMDSEKNRKRKHEDRSDDENEDLQFFKSVLPDIKGFTAKEKRKFKMGVLQLIDDVENERKRCNSIDVS